MRSSLDRSPTNFTNLRDNFPRGTFLVTRRRIYCELIDCGDVRNRSKNWFKGKVTS